MGIFSGSMIRRREVVDPLTVGLLAWLLDPAQLATGSPWNDVSGNGRHFSDEGGMSTLSTGGPESDYAAQFTGANGYLSRAFEAAMDLRNVDFCVSAWYYFPASADGVGFRRRWTSNGSSLSTRPSADSFNLSGAQFGWRFVPTDVTGDRCQTSEIYNKEQWHHVVEQHREASPLNQLWVNGTKVVTNTTAPVALDAHTNPFWIGRSAGTAGNWGGRMARFGVWSRILSDSEIERVYNSGDGITAADIGL
jgi:hypothetical protein